MDEHTERTDLDDSPDATRTDVTGDDRPDGGGGESENTASSGPLSRARSVGTETVGVVVDAVLDAL
ncbi:hypothetical protein [Halorubrum sp. N11]|uniref:hypothetical protein n=1 Tax=Halorubrum sp. N11 TaxID=3402276 RepID=UPI003EB7EFAD